MRDTHFGKLVAPKHVQMNSWARQGPAVPCGDGGLTAGVLAD
eukprot:gene35847-63003_t